MRSSVKKRVTINLDQNILNEFDRPSSSSSEQPSLREKEQSVFDDDDDDNDDYQDDEDVNEENSDEDDSLVNSGQSKIECLRVEEKHQVAANGKRSIEREILDEFKSEQ